MNRLALVLTLALTACGSSGGGAEQTAGGMVGVYEPTGAPICFMILHQGHAFFDGGTGSNGEEPHPEYDLRPAAEAFTKAGCRVYALEMPPRPHDAGPLQIYYKPVVDLIGQIQEESGSPIYMAGFSGGGWTTTIAVSNDSRIVKGYSVDGDPVPCDPSEWEHMATCTDFPDIYASAGTRLMHINAAVGPSSDPNYKYVIDPTTTAHTFSPWAVQYIIDDLGL